MSGRSTSRLITAVRRRLWFRRELRIYCCTADQIRQLPRSSVCRRDQWADLEACDAWSYQHLTREAYLAIARQRQAEGAHHLYSRVERGTLVHYGWTTMPQERAPDAALGLEFIPPAGSAALWDYFTHPAARGRGLYLESLRQCLHDAVELDGATQAFIYVDAANGPSRRVIERAGFSYRGSLVSVRRLLWTRRYATWVGEPFEVRLLGSGRPAETREDCRPLPRLQHAPERERVVHGGDGPAGEDHLPPRPSRQDAV